MELLDQKGVINIILPFRDDIVSCIQGGFDDYFEKYKDISHEHSTRSRTALIYDGMLKHARRTFSNRNGAKVIDDLNETAILLIQNKVAVRFKKFRERNNTSNVRTERISQYRGQEQMELIPDTVHLYAGYQPDQYFRKIDYILITCPNYYGNSWEFHLTKDDYTESIIPMGLTDDPQSQILLPNIKIKTKGKNAV